MRFFDRLPDPCLLPALTASPWTASPLMTIERSTLSTEDTATFFPLFAVFISLLRQLFGVLWSQAKFLKKNAATSIAASIQVSDPKRSLVAEPLAITTREALPVVLRKVTKAGVPEIMRSGRHTYGS